jgi:hypothetical protein
MACSRTASHHTDIAFTRADLRSCSSASAPQLHCGGQMFLKVRRHRLVLGRGDHGFGHVVQLGVGVLGDPDKDLPRLLLRARPGRHQHAASHVNDRAPVQSLPELFVLLAQQLGLLVERHGGVIADMVTGQAGRRRTVRACPGAATPGARAL